MKRVSYKVAKAIKKAGYPQGNTDTFYAGSQRYNTDRTIFEGSILKSTDNIGLLDCDIPTYIEVWLWLWEKKSIQIVPEPRSSLCVYIKAPFYALPKELSQTFTNVEEAIITAIEYLVDNNLIE